MASYEPNSSKSGKQISSNERTLVALCDDQKTLNGFFDPVKSYNQLTLEANGWEYVGNEIVTNYHVGLDVKIEPHGDSIRRMMDDYKVRIYPDKTIGFFCAYDAAGKRLINVSMFGIPVRIAAVYIRDKELGLSEVVDKKILVA
jgi:hypothetical protein